VTDRPTITVVVCTMGKRREDLARCLESLCTAEGIEDEEVLVVSRRGDDLGDVVGPFTDRMPVRTAHSRLEALSDKRNVGIERGRGGIIAYIDDDATVTPGYLTALRRAFEPEDVDGVAGALEPVFDVEPEGDLRDSAFRIGGFNRWKGEVRPDTWIGANCAFRRAALKEVGLFDVRLGPGGALLPWGDDSDMFRRFGETRRMVFGPEVLVRHRIQAGRANVGYVLTRSFRAGRAHCVMDYLHKRDFWRRALPVPVALAHLLVIGRWSRSRFETAVGVRRLTGYVWQMVLLAIGGASR
jgi:glycosyltransferase involved in cell wall biosynthesis